MRTRLISTGHQRFLGSYVASRAGDASRSFIAQQPGPVAGLHCRESSLGRFLAGSETRSVGAPYYVQIAIASASMAALTAAKLRSGAWTQDVASTKHYACPGETNVGRTITLLAKLSSTLHWLTDHTANEQRVWHTGICDFAFPVASQP